MQARHWEKHSRYFSDAHTKYSQPGLGMAAANDECCSIPQCISRLPISSHLMPTVIGRRGKASEYVGISSVLARNGRASHPI